MPHRRPLAKYRPQGALPLMRLLRRGLPALSAAAVLVLCGGAALANSTGTYTIPFTNSVVVQNSNGACSYGPEGGTLLSNQDIAANSTQYQAVQGSVSASSPIPSGATVLSETASGTATLVGGNAGTYEFRVGGALAPPWPSASPCDGEVPSGATASVSLGGGTVAYSVDNPGIFSMWGGGGTLYAGAAPFEGCPSNFGCNGSSGVVSLGSLTVSAQYAFTPNGITVAQDISGAGLDATISWGANGNDAGTVYTLQRETLNGSGVSVGWTTIYQGTATSFNTAGTSYAQQCGVGYYYRVAVLGSENNTPWDTTAEWDEYPCSVSFTGATPTSITISWPEVTASTVPVIVWCEEDTPAGGVSCVQEHVALSAGQTSATLTGLVPNAEYALWACSETNGWGCPQTNNWTYAATPTLSPYNNPSGLSYDQQPLTWTTNGNAPGTVYCMLQGTYAQSGAWQGGTCPYYGTGTSFTANQSVGTSYAYAVWANNAGYSGASPASNSVLTQVASTPTLTVTGTTTATVSWSTVANMVTTGVACSIQGSSDWVQYGPATGGATSLAVTGLQPDTDYSCATYAIDSNQGIQWWQASAPEYTDADPPADVTVTSVAQTSLRTAWSTNGNPTGVLYQTYLEPASGGSGVDWQTTYNAYAIYGDLSCGVSYTPYVQTEQGNTGNWTTWVAGPQTITVPCEPTVSGTDGGLGWSPSAGRGFVHLSWPAVPGATGYTLYVWDGAEYESFDLGDATSWSSQAALIYPPDAALYPNVSEGSKSPPVFSQNAGGLNLRDLPLDLYCTTGTYYCTTAPAENYWFTVAAYDESGSSAAFDIPGQSANSYYEPTLPLQTDPAGPTITAFQVNGGAPYTYAQQASFSLSATEGTSGIAAYALSNNGSTWTTTAVGGCTVGQVAACQTSLDATGTWSLSPGPGSKTVYARVESTAGVWSAPETAQVYVNVDQTVPTVDVALDGGNASTASTAATAAVTVSDPVAGQAGLTFEARWSADGGQTWSGWTAEGAATSFDLTVTLPGGASGQRSVLVQVQDSDDNLGQGGATIYYAAPGTTQPSGTVSAVTPVACTWPVDGGTVSATCVTQPLVNLTLSPPASAVQMRVSLNGATWGGWTPVGDALPIDLGASAGLKTVWVQYEDAQGDITTASGFGPAYYVLDPGPPTVQASWLGGASATNSSGDATLLLQAGDPVGTAGMTALVTENGGTLYSGTYADSLPLTLTGSGYQTVQITVTDIAGNATSTSLGIYVQ